MNGGSALASTVEALNEELQNIADLGVNEAAREIANRGTYVITDDGEEIEFTCETDGIMLAVNLDEGTLTAYEQDGSLQVHLNYVLKDELNRKVDRTSTQKLG